MKLCEPERAPGRIGNDRESVVMLDFRQAVHEKQLKRTVSFPRKGDMATARNQSKKKQRVENQLTEKVIKQRVGERSFQRGQDHFKSDAVFDCRQQGERLKARCRGQSADSYVVSAHIAGGQIQEAECHCPVGSGGYCKHVAALLLKWLHTPDEFREIASLEERLSECSKSRLVELIQQMIDREPDLESWLEVALPTAVSSGNRAKGEVVKPDAYGRQTVAAFSNAGYGWEADREVTAALESLKKIGDQFRSRKNVESAVAVYRGILEGIVGEYESFRDENGDVSVVAGECITALEECLPQCAEGSEARESVLRPLFDVLQLDINLGGIGLSDEVPEILTEQTTAAERATIAGWIRKALPAGRDFSSNWRRQAWGGLLLDFAGEPEDDDAYLKHCREFGLTGDLVKRLLERGRLEEALREIRSSSDYELMGLADQLVAHKHINLAYTLVRDRLSADEKGRNNRQLREWLKRFCQSRKNWKPLLELCVEEFRRQPSLSQYQEIRKLATKLKTWDTLRPDLLSSVPRDSNDLIRIHLDEGEVDQAIMLWESRSGKRRVAVGWDRVDLEVARAAEKSHPETALRIYRAEVKSLISARGRQSYQSACQFLKKIRPLLKMSGHGDDWDDYISRLREENRSLRAFQEELKKAHL